MAVRMAGVSARLLESAAVEFEKHGFHDASLRRIAASSGTTTHTIYTRFGDKEGLFAALVEPVADEYLSTLAAGDDDYYAVYAVGPDSQLDVPLKTYARMIDTMYDNKGAFRLLIDHAEGTRFADYLERVATFQSERIFLEAQRRGVPMDDNTKLFVHIQTRAFFDSIFEMFRHDLTREQTQTFIVQLVAFFQAGVSHFESAGRTQQHEVPLT